jgi:hypothetical protein
LSTYPDTVLFDTPILYYRLDTISGTESDLSGNGHTLTYGAGMVRGVTGLLTSDADLAASFPFVGGGFCNTPHAADLTFTAAPFTIEAWINCTATGGVQWWFGKGEFGNGGYGVGLNGTAVELTLVGFGPLTTSSVTIANDVRYHIVTVFDTNLDANFYINGEFKETVAGSSNPATNSQQAAVGGDSSAGTNQFNGVIDELAVYNAALSPARIPEHWRVGISGPMLIASVSSFGPFG